MLVVTKWSCQDWCSPPGERLGIQLCTTLNKNVLFCGPCDVQRQRGLWFSQWLSKKNIHIQKFAIEVWNESYLPSLRKCSVTYWIEWNSRYITDIRIFFSRFFLFGAFCCFCYSFFIFCCFGGLSWHCSWAVSWLYGWSWSSGVCKLCIPGGCTWLNLGCSACWSLPSESFVSTKLEPTLAITDTL